MDALWQGSFGSWYAFTSATLVHATPLIVLGLARAVLAAWERTAVTTIIVQGDVASLAVVADALEVGASATESATG